MYVCISELNDSFDFILSQNNDNKTVPQMNYVIKDNCGADARRWLMMRGNLTYLTGQDIPY